ncbi:trimethylamine methyltransferase family protein [Deltaproteobacteria bacterium OttesenSCG-928-M10]|nr:trimethylamine methyltransferase family protein [Deltaproteobacteria bacterium OttesenSCG-928-M10]
MLPVYNVLSPDQVNRIHEASLKVLEKTGVFLDHPKAQDILSGLGAKISDDRKRVFFPPALVTGMMEKAPPSFPCSAFDPKYDLRMKLGNVYMRQVAGPPAFFDMVTNTARPLTLKDNLEAALLANALPNIDLAGAMTPQDINVNTYDIAVVKGLFENSLKHFWALTTHSSHLKYELEMAVAVAGSEEALKARPLFSGIVCVIDPLRYPADEIERLLLYGRYHIPVRVPISSLVGANAPFPLAGAMTQINAEFLSSVAIVQALCPGMGLWYYPLLQMLDMKSGRSVASGPELMLLYGASADMSRFYGLPSTFSSGPFTDTQSHQAMYHYGTNQTLSALLQITEQGGAGSIQAGSFYSPQALVIVDESMGYLKAMLNGIEINEETLAVDDIDAMMEKGDYFSSRLTMKYLRQEKRYTPSVLDWRQFPVWEEDPSTIVERAEAKVQEILRNPAKPSLRPEVQTELNRLMQAAEKEFA